jgi:hypothetical protein
MADKKSDPVGANSSRRTFLKKAAYSAPTLIALGVLSGPLAAKRSRSRAGTEEDCDPFTDPDCNPPSGPVTFEEQPQPDLESDREEWT